MSVKDLLKSTPFAKAYFKYKQDKSRAYFDSLSDEEFIKERFRKAFGKEINLENPETFNEKLQWLKLYNRDPLYTKLVDKYEVKEYIKEKIGEEYIIKTLGVWDKFNEIDFDKLPDKFVLKCTHDSGGLVICNDKSKLDKHAAKEKIESSLKRNFYLQSREWPYKNVKPRIIAEEYMEDSKTQELRDYKFFCFDGCVKCFKIDYDRDTFHRANYFDTEGKLLEFGEVVCPPDFSKELSMPVNLEKMINFAEIISKDMPFVRTDFYEADNKVYFGEITFFPAGGVGHFTSEEWDYILGSWITLPEKRQEKD